MQEQGKLISKIIKFEKESMPRKIALYYISRGKKEGFQFYFTNFALNLNLYFNVKN